MQTTSSEMRGTNLSKSHPLHGAFEEWIELMADPTWSSSDCPWWYNERASVSQFAGALWRTGGWVFEEFSSTKKPLGGGTKFKGRVDLMFWPQKDRGGPQFIAEAKTCWLSLRSPFALHRIQTAINKAVSDVEKDRNYHGRYQRLGIAFASPIMPIKFSNRIPTKVENLLKKLNAEPELSMAWYFRTAGDIPSHHNYVYPGIIMCMRSAN